MPTNYIKKLHDEHKGSIAELEQKWDEAKAQAEKQNQGSNWAYVTKIFQNMVGASMADAAEVFASLKASSHGWVVARADRGHARCTGFAEVCAKCMEEATRLEASLKPMDLNAATRLRATKV